MADEKGGGPDLLESAYGSDSLWIRIDQDFVVDRFQRSGRLAEGGTSALRHLFGDCCGFRIVGHCFTQSFDGLPRNRNDVR